MAASDQKLAIVILISGNGSNLQAIMDAIDHGELPATIRAVISSRQNAYGLQRAVTAGIPTEVLKHEDYLDRETYDHALQTRIDHYQPGLIVLAGFMRMLSANFVSHYAGRLLNVHPSLLPAFTGLNTHQRAIDAGAKEHGASIHVVTEELDAGPVIIQARIPVSGDDSTETLAAKIKQLEHRIYPLVIRWFAERRIHIQEDSVVFDGKPLTGPLDYPSIKKATR